MPSSKRVDVKEAGGSERLKGGRCDESCDREREKFIVRQPPIGGKDDYDIENSWISDGLPSSRYMYETHWRSSLIFLLVFQ